MKHQFDRRKFIGTATAALAIGLTGSFSSAFGKRSLHGGKIGIIGLDTSHSVAFTKSLNASDIVPELKGYRVIAAYPKGSNDIKSSTSRIPGYIEDVKKLGVEIVNSIDELLQKVDFVLLETNDGRLHLEQALPVLKAGKRMFIDKPIAASLSDAMAIYNASEQFKTPVFTSSSLRFMESVQSVVEGKIGKVLGADTYSPATLEKTHPDLFWYGIHGVEVLFTVMGTGCKNVIRVHTNDTDVVVGEWEDSRVGTFRGTRSGTHDYGGTVYGEKGNLSLGPFHGYDSLLVRIIDFFETGNPPVTSKETLEILAFMEAADESSKKAGARVSLEEMMKKARKKMDKKKV